MAVALFSGNNLEVIVGGPEVDVKTGEFHTFSATPTNFTIESGASASDHIVESPDSLEISWVMSNLDTAGQSYGNRAATLLDALYTKIKARGLYEVVTRHKLYPSMVITQVLADHIGPFSGGLRGRVIFQAVNRRTLDRATIPDTQPEPSVSKTASTQTNSGRVEATTPTDADKQKAASANRSVLSQIFSR